MTNYDPSSLAGAKYKIQHGEAAGRDGDPSSISNGLAIVGSQAFDGTLDPSNTQGFLESLYSGGGNSPPVNTVAPTLTGSSTSGSTLTCTTGSWGGNPSPTFSYQFKNNGTPISGTTPNTLLLTDAMIGHAITCVVTATNVAGSVSQTTSNTITVTASGAIVDIADSTALNAMLYAGVGASGGKTYRLAADTDFGTIGVYGVDFSSNPITIFGQSGTVAQWIEFDGASGQTWEDINFYGSHPSFGCGVSIHNSNTSFSSILTFNRVTTNSGASTGTQSGNGWQLRNCGPSHITINGHADAATPDISGRGNAVGIIDCWSDAGFIIIHGLTIDNTGVDCFLISGSKNVTLDYNFAQNFYWGVGDHPDFMQFFTSSGNPCTNIVLTNNGMMKGSGGGGQQGFFIENGVNFTIQKNWTYTDTFDNMIANAGGSTFLIDNNFIQGISGHGGLVITRGAAVNTTVTNTSAGAIANYAGDGVNPGYVPNPLPGSNTIISDVTYGDFTALDTWLAANPSAVRRPT